jgi:limonene-1,2-epoxide hydrolase
MNENSASLPSDSREQSKSLRSGIQIVEAFLAAATRLDMDAAFAYLADDIEYQNVPLPPDRGRKNVERTLRAFMKVANVFEVKMHHIAEADGVVLTERTDTLRGPLLDTEFWVCGTFIIRDGRIAVWRDRFDVGQVTAQILLSPLRKVARGVGLLGR